VYDFWLLESIFQISIGGYLAIQPALTHIGKVKAMIGVSLMIDLKIPFFTQVYEKNMVGYPTLPENAIETHMSSLKGRKIVPSATPPDRMDLAISVIQQGKIVEMIENDTNLLPMERLDLVKDIPPMFLIHGKNDSIVPYRSSEAFVEKMRNTHP
jgi:alpha-beta hydrolase superfamily lysophospholipase